MREARNDGTDRAYPGGVSGVPDNARPGWVRDVELPRSLDELRGPTSGSVRLPLRIYWSGPDPQGVEWDASSTAGRRSLYEVVLREGNLDDVRQLVNGRQLVDVWDRLFLQPWLRAAWEPLVEAARSAA